MIRSLCFATAVALLASPTGLAFKFKDDGEVDEAATFFGEDSDSTLAAEPAAPREERKIETKVTDFCSKLRLTVQFFMATWPAKIPP